MGPMDHGRKVKEGFCCTLDLGDNRWVVVSQVSRWEIDASGHVAVGIDYKKLDIIPLKDRVHHRAFWDTVAKTDVRTSVPGQGPSDLRLLHYNNMPFDTFPVGRRWNQ
jgi:microcystin degradation protein MlrC